MQLNKRVGKDKASRLKRRHMRLRKKVAGTAERPRLMVRKTLKHLYILAIDDSAAGGGRTLLTVTTNRKGVDQNKNYRNTETAKKIGVEAGAALKAKGIDSVVFDRGGFRYHGVIQALCEAVRESGIRI